MMKKNYFQCGITTKNIVINYLLALLPLLIYGFYKNAIVVYNRGLIDFTDVIIQILIIILTVAISFVSDFIYCKIRKKDTKEYLQKSFSLVFSLILLLSIPPNVNKLIYIFSLVILNILSKIIPYNKFSINIVAITKIILILGVFFTNGINYANIYEQTKNISYTLYNSFFGKTIGGYGSTSIFLILLAYIYLCTKIHYKKEIPIYSIFSFTIFGTLYLAISKNNPINIINILITSNIIFVLVFIASIPFYSPVSKEGTIIYSILNGVLSFLFMKAINIYEGAFIAIIVTSSLSKIIDIVVLKIRSRHLK